MFQPQRVVEVTQILCLLMQMTMKELTIQLSHPVEREELNQQVVTNGGGGRSKKEDKYGLMDNMVIESLPPMREEGPRVFIIS